MPFGCRLSDLPAVDILNLIIRYKRQQSGVIWPLVTTVEMTFYVE